MRHYVDKRCLGCGASFTPTGPRSLKCNGCREVERAIPGVVVKAEASAGPKNDWGYVRTGDDVIRKELPKLAIDGPRGKEDNRPIGSKCQQTCHMPYPGAWSHCTVCHNTFAGRTMFDDHRYDGWCIDPEALGLTCEGGTWATPEGHEARHASAERLAKARGKAA